MAQLTATLIRPESLQEHPHDVRGWHIQVRPQVERAIAKSTETYCGVHAMLSKGSTITHDLVFVA
jgi:uncharacterized OsmC-like protein